MARRSLSARLARLEHQPRAVYRTIVVVDTLAPELRHAAPADLEQCIADAQQTAKPRGLVVVVRETPGGSNET
jgi:hypothetical protein